MEVGLADWPFLIDFFLSPSFGMNPCPNPKTLSHIERRVQVQMPVAPLSARHHTI